ncbi:MAG: hypothetical protein ACRDT4_06980, partial [Micromonosporaceae bacterium]
MVGRRGFLAAGGLAVVSGFTGPAQAVPPELAEPPPGEPASALRRLLDGNRRFVAGRQRHPRQSPRHLRELARGQKPYAITLGCADSRVPPELLFDQGLGDISTTGWPAPWPTTCCSAASSSA